MKRGNLATKAAKAYPWPMDPIIMASVFVTFFFAAFLKGTAGLGFATTSLGIMAAYIDLRLAIPLVIIPSLLSNTMVMIDAGGFLRMLKKFWLLYIAAMPGLALGLWLLGGGNTSLPRLVLGSTMVLYGVWGLWGGQLRLPTTPLLNGTVGLITGLVNGLTGSQIMPILPYLMSLDITKDELVQSINTSFTFASLVMLFGLGRMGLVTVEIMFISTAGVIPVFAGIKLGGRVRRKLPEEVFRKVVLFMVALLGVGLVLKALHG